MDSVEVIVYEVPQILQSVNDGDRLLGNNQLNTSCKYYLRLDLSSYNGLTASIEKQLLTKNDAFLPYRFL